MTQIHKHQTIAKRVAAENPYQRAAAVWVAEKLSKNPNTIYGVDFHHEDGWSNDEGTYWEGENGLSYFYNGRQLTFNCFSYPITPGSFIQECVEILNREERDATTDGL